jgi:opacity protein-like surface antigen
MFRKILTAGAMLFISAASFAELDWNITGSGARAAGMGNAFIGIADDATAINWNPGGLTALEHFEASFVGAFVMDKEEYSSEDNASYNYSDDLSYKHFNLSFFSLAYPFKAGEKKLVLAGGMQKQLDFFYEDSGSDYSSTSKGGVYTINIGAGYQLLPYLSLGATANIWTGSSESEFEYNYETYNEYYEYSYDKFKGLNFVVGALFDMSMINENVPLKIGAVIKTPFELEYDFSYYYFEDLYYTEDEGGSSFKAKLPLMFGLGASYRFGENLTVGLDFERRNYSKTDLSSSDEDVNQIRLGMEYLLVTDAVVIPLRIGFFNYPTLWANVDYEFDSWNGEYVEVKSEQLVGYGMSLGSGVIFDKFALDVSYSFLSYENIFNYNDLDGYEWSQSWKNTRNTLNFSGIIYIDSFINK